MTKLINLFLQFFHIGVFSFGGGYATLPFLYDLSEKFQWFTTSQLTNMLAVSSVTPGPVGLNMATYTGFITTGILGSIITTTAIMLPSYIFVTLTYKILDKFKTNEYIKISVKTLKATGCALLSAVGIKLIFTSDLHLLGFITLFILLLSGIIKKRDPIFYLGISAIIGYVLGFFNLIGV